MITVKMIIIAIGSSSYMTLTLREYANIAIPQPSNISVNIYLFKQTVIELGKLVGKQTEGFLKIKKRKTKSKNINKARFTANNWIVQLHWKKK